MTGPWHYAEAERLITGTHQCRVPDDEGTPCPFCTRDIARAQVHATLALAAATALGGSDGPPAPDWDVWYRTASEGPGAKQRRIEAEAAEQAEFAKDAQP